MNHDERMRSLNDQLNRMIPHERAIWLQDGIASDGKWMWVIFGSILGAIALITTVALTL